MTSPAKTDQDLADIFDTFVESVNKTLREGEEIATRDGDRIKVRPGPAYMSMVRQFLKDQGISATPSHPGLKKAQEAAQTALGAPMPFPDTYPPTLQQ